MSTCTGKCAPGYYCSGGTITPTPTGTAGTICAIGTYCPEGSVEETKCPAGKYNPNTGQKDCLACPAGFYCVEGESEPKACKKGHYCEGNTSTENGEPCAEGKYQDETNHWKCLECLPGYACETRGMTGLTNSELCAKGYYCKYGSKTKQPVGLTEGDRCAKGFYCNEGSSFQTPCPPGLACP